MLFILMIMIGAIFGVICNIFYKNINKKVNEFKINKAYLIYIVIISRLIVIFFKLQNLLLITEILQLILLLIIIYYNKKELSIIIAAIGFILNLIVMIFNQGRMPVSTLNNYSILNIKHIIMSNTTNLRCLSDVLNVIYPFSLGIGAFSIGDLIITIGLSILCFRLVKNKE